MQIFRLLSCLSLILLTNDAIVLACAWDQDTLAAEAKGIPDVLHIVTGRFERNPPLYYELRLKRVTAELRTDPGQLENYDNAGVACDHLKRHDEALAWMAKKKLQLDRMPHGTAERREHMYRYLANTGTFWSHRWIRNGANRKRISEMKTARKFIAEAIALNPNAHFGREKYQLRAMDWVISPPAKPTKAEMARDGSRAGLPNILGVEDTMFDAPAAIKGLSGIIVLGNSWENVDLFNTLAKCIQADEERSSVEYLARLRAAELVDAGRKSLLPTAPSGAKLKSLIKNHMIALHDPQLRELEGTYTSLRKEADQWQAHRTAYMVERLKAGRHPDTDPSFWRDYREAPAPGLAEQEEDEWAGVLFVFALLALGVFVFIRKKS